MLYWAYRIWYTILQHKNYLILQILLTVLYQKLIEKLKMLTISRMLLILIKKIIDRLIL